MGNLNTLESIGYAEFIAQFPEEEIALLRRIYPGIAEEVLEIFVAIRHNWILFRDVKSNNFEMLPIHKRDNVGTGKRVPVPDAVGIAVINSGQVGPLPENTYRYKIGWRSDLGFKRAGEYYLMIQ